MVNIFVDASNTSAGSGTSIDPYNTIQAALLDAGFRPPTQHVDIFVQDGTYAENLIIDRGDLSLITTNGSANVTIQPASGSAISLSGDLGAAETVSITGFTLSGGSTGVNVASSTILGSLVFDDITVSGAAQSGIVVNDVPGLGSVTIQNSTFVDAGSGVGNSNGSAAIVLFDFHGDATISNVDISNTDTALTPVGDIPDNAIQIAGFDQTTYDVLDPIGTVSLSDVSITGFYHKPPLIIQGFTNLSNLTLTNISIEGSSTWGPLVFVDPIASNGAAVQGTSGYPGFFAGNTPGATNTLDLSGVTIVANTNPAATVDVFVRGTDANDIYTGTNGRDFLNAPAEGDIDYGGDDELHGMAGDDTLFGGTGDDIIDGGADTDTAIYTGPSSGYSFGVTIDGVTGLATAFNTVTDTDTGTLDEGADTLTGIEILAFDGGAEIFDLTDPVQLFDGTSAFRGTFTTIQDAIDAAGADYSILVQDGTYPENLTINQPGLSIASVGGSGNSTISVASGSAISLSGDLGAAETVSITGFTLSGGSTGVNVASSTILGSLVFDDITVSGAAQSGIVVNDVPGLGSVTIQNSTFVDAGSGVGNSNGSAAIVLFDFHGDATISNVDISNTDTALTPVGDIPDNAIQIAGFDQTTYDVLDPIGTVSLSDVSITGFYHKPPLIIQGFTNLSNLTLTNISIEGSSTWGPLVFVDPIASNGAAVQGTSGYPGFFAGNTPGATNTLDLSGVTIVANTNPAATVDVFVRGTDANDIYTGTNGRDFLNAPAEGDIDYGGDDELHGMAGDDTLFGGTGDDIIDGGADTDTAIYTGPSSGYSFGVTIDGVTGLATAFNTVTDTDTGTLDEGADTLTGIEILAFDGGAEIFDLTDPVQLFDGTSAFRGTFTSVEDGVDAANSMAGSVLLADGTIDAEGLTPDGQIHVTGDLSISGQGAAATTIQANASTGTSGDSRGMFLVDSTMQLDIADVTVDGNGFNIWQGIRSLGSVDVDNVTFSNITYQASGSPYAGTAVAAFGTNSVLEVSNSTFTNIGRIGAQFFGTSTTGIFENNTYTGKGAVDGLDYAVEVGGGAQATIIGNTISNNTGIALSDGSTSAGILVSTFFNPGTEATITDNVLTNNTVGIAVGYDMNDTSVVNLTGTNTVTSTDPGSWGLTVVGNAVVTGVNASLTGNGARVFWDAGDGNNMIEGAALADNLSGNDGDDTINGNAGDDTIDGGNGNDILNGGIGADFMLGGDGDDTYFIDNTGDAAFEFAGEGTDTVHSSVSYTLFANLENLTLTGAMAINGIGNNDNNTINGNDADNILDGRGGSDIINGGDGNDTLNGGLGVDTVDGGDGIDTLDLSGATNTQKVNLVTNVNIGGFANNDTFLNIENVIGSSTRGDDITGTAGSNTLQGLGADDILRGFNGDDILEGGDNNDYLYGGRGADVLDGGNGIDWAMYNDSSHGVIVDLGGVGSGGIYSDGDTYISIERVRGSNFDDTITMDGASNKVIGGDGDDTIYGMGGKDQLRGGNDNDRINGGADNDTMFGDAGNDIFEFDLGSGQDFIADFEDDIDTIELDGNLRMAEIAGMSIIDIVMTYGTQVNANRIDLDFGNGDVLKILATGITEADLYDDITVV